MRIARTAATLILVLVAGCTTPGTEPAPSNSPATPASPATTAAPQTAGMSITIRKSGGIAGVNETLVVDAQGKWTRTTKSGTTTNGQLTPEQLAQATKLATDPRLLAEAQAAPQSPANCADAFLYSVTIGPATVSFSDCGSGTPPATAELVRYLDQITK